MDPTVFRLMAQCPPGLEPLLLAELRALGIRASALQGGASWTGGWNDLVAANLHLRVASRVLIELGTFGARALGELERKGAALPWDRVPGTSPARFRVSSSRSRLYHEGAIEERLRSAGDLPAFEEGESDAPLLVVRVHRDKVTVRLDTSGEHLHRRGYRLHVGVAPLRETLAAALLLAGPMSAGGASAGPPPVVDPFCGSGTVAIEAALLARRIAPGLSMADRSPRHFAFRDWPDFPPEIWDEAVAGARATILPELPAGSAIFGSDRDAGVIEAAAANAERAGVLGDISLARATLSKAPGPGELAGAGDASGWLVTNPPYGGRLGDRRRLRALYSSLGRAFQPGGRFSPGWSLLYLSGDPVLDTATGLPLEERFATSHGGLRVRAVASEAEAEAEAPEASSEAS
ncbi:RNA methyltransferase [soil metagenome]